jgi:predicted O-methyltransferase YrrM
VQNPRFAFSLLRDGRSARDQVFLEQFRWTFGDLPRVSLASIVPASRTFDLQLLRPFDRTRDTSITIEELCCLLAIAKDLAAKRVLEIGTWDGNTTLNLAANTDAEVVTVDLPPDFDSSSQGVAQPMPRINNMTPREALGRQLQNHPLKARIRQVFGDSARLDWNAFGPPFDLIFIDGCHDYSYVLSDTGNARAHLARGGAIVWHDYGIFRDVSRVVDMTARSSGLRVHAIEGTRLAVGFDR